MALADLSLALRQGAQGEANLAGLNEQYTAANKLANTQTARPDRFGRTSGLAVINDLVGGIRGDNKLRTLAPQREAARAAVADNKSALPLYQAKVQQDAATQAQTNFETTQAATLAAARAKREQEIADAETKRAREDQKSPLVTKVSPDGDERTVRYNAQTGRAWLDDGTEIPNFSQWTDPATKTEAINRGSHGGKGFDKKSGEYIDAINRVDDVFGLMTNITPEQEALMNSPMHQAKMAAIKSLTPEAFETLAESQFSGYDAATKEMLVSLNAMGAEERKRLFGAALTDNERKDSKSFLAATMGRGLPWIRTALEGTKRTNDNALLRVDNMYSGDTYRNMLTGLGTIPEGYTAKAFELGNAPEIGSALAAPEGVDAAEWAKYSPEQQAAWKAKFGGATE